MAAKYAACVLFCTPNFLKIELISALTVCSLKNNRSAICLLSSPRARNFKISFSLLLRTIPLISEFSG